MKVPKNKEKEYNVYIDESGDEGINKDNLSEEDLEKVRRQEEESEEPFEEMSIHGDGA